MQQFFRDWKWITWEEMVNLKRSEKEEFNSEVISVTIREEAKDTEDVTIDKVELVKELLEEVKEEVKETKQKKNKIPARKVIKKNK